MSATPPATRVMLYLNPNNLHIKKRLTVSPYSPVTLLLQGLFFLHNGVTGLMVGFKIWPERHRTLNRKKLTPDMDSYMLTDLPDLFGSRSTGNAFHSNQRREKMQTFKKGVIIIRPGSVLGHPAVLHHHGLDGGFDHSFSWDCLFSAKKHGSRINNRC